MVPFADALLARLWTASWQAAVVAAVVMAVRGALGRGLTARWRHALWMLVLLRLLVPVQPPSRLSLFGVGDALARRPVPADVAPATVHVTAIVPTDAVAVEPAVVAPPAVAAPSRVPLVGLVIWLAGAAVFVARPIVGTVRFGWSLRAASAAVPPRLAGLFARCCDEVGRRPTLVVTTAVNTPAACGVLRPRVLLPAGLASLPDGPLRLVFLHELEHVRRWDVAADWLWAMAGAIHWFNPVLWLVGPLRRHDRELARDEAVLSRLGPAGAEAYGRTLLDLARPARAVPLCPGMFGGTRPLRQRVEAVARFRRGRTAAVALGVAVLTVAAVCLLTAPPRPDPRPAVVAPPATAPTASAAHFVRVVHGEPEPLSPADAATAALLDRRLPELRFNANALSDVFDFLRDTTGANLYVDWPALQAVGVRRDTPVTARLREIKFSKALQLIFKSVEGDADDHQLDYAVDAGVITISSRRDLNRNTVTREYDINDLLFVPPDYGGPAAPSPRADRVAEIVQYVRQNVDPNSWGDVGGRADPDRPGRISASGVRPVLLITATPENHAKIRAVLDSLRASQALQVSIQTRLVTVPDADLAGLPADVRRLLGATVDRPPASPMLDPAEAAAVIRATAAVPGTQSITFPRLTLFSGQRSALSVTTAEQTCVSAYTAVIRPGNATAYEPVMRTVRTGLDYDVQATVSPDRRHVFVTLHPTVSRLAGLVTEPWAAAPAAGTVRRPVVLTSETRTSCSIPDGATLLVGCGGFAPAATEPAVDDPAVAAEVERARAAHVFLLVRPVVLVVTQQQTFPLLDHTVP